MKDQVHIVAIVIPLLAVLVVAAGAAALARFASSRAAVAFVVGALIWAGVSGGLATGEPIGNARGSGDEIRERYTAARLRAS